jgi:small GTP-binding protein
MIQISRKVCLLGDYAVGKTSLVQRFVYNLFDDKYLSTMGVKVARKTLAIPKNEEVVELTIMLWDLAGSEEFDRFRSAYLRGSAGAVLVCDSTRRETLHSLAGYVDVLRSANPAAQIVLAANKRDLVDDLRISPAEVEAAAAALETPFFLTSAKTGEAVEQLFARLGKMLLR